MDNALRSEKGSEGGLLIWKIPRMWERVVRESFKQRNEKEASASL